jgi:hypothetical protein
MNPLRSLKLARQQAEQTAEEVVKKHKSPSLPVDPSEIAKKNEIFVQEMPLAEPGISGVFMKIGDSFGIGYSTRIKNQGFINFTIAHELGHYFLPGHVDYVFRDGEMMHHSGGEFLSAELHEKEADYFAAALLMPKVFFVPMMRTVGKGIVAIKKLKLACNTSLTATAIRYAAFAEDPVAVILSGGNCIEFCALSESLSEINGPRGLSKGDFLPEGTPTAKFNANPKHAGSFDEVGAYVSLDDWFEGAPQVEMCEDIIGLGNYGKTLTVLFTDQEIDDDEFGGTD